MSNDFKKILVNDSRLDVTDQLSFGVLKGGQNVTATVYNAISQSPNVISFNVAVPSEVTLIDTRVLFQSTYTLKISTSVLGGAVAPNGNLLPVGGYLVNYGLADALSPFPLAQSMSTASVTLNNNTISINSQDILAMLLRFYDKREISKYNSSTPTMYDTYFNYSDALDTNKNVLGGWENSVDNSIVNRGAFNVNWISSAIDNSGNVAQLPIVAGAVPASVYVNFTVTEPLLMSPFSFNSTEGKAMYGLQNMNFVFNLNNGNTVWRSANNFGQTASIVNVTNSRLLFTMLSAHPSQLLPSRCVLPYLDYPRYITNSVPGLGPGLSTTMTVSSLQLNQVPDKLCIVVRKAMSSRNCNDSDAFLCIDQVSISFNNNSGILSSCVKEQLYEYSSQNGSNQSFYEYCGKANVWKNGQSTPIATAGSFLCLQFGKDIQLTDDFYSVSSIGQFNLQISLTVRNQTTNTYGPGALEIVVMPINAGVIALERGTCSTFTAILSKNDVIEASEQEPYSQTEIKRLIGGKGLLSTLSSVGRKIMPRLPGLVKKGLEAKKGSELLGAMGYGYSGAGYSGASKLSNRYV